MKFRLWFVVDLDDEERPPLAAFPSPEEAHGYVALTGADQCCVDVEIVTAEVDVDLAGASEGTVLPRQEGGGSST